ncbi:MAG: hypothetical protein EBQ67_08330 [Sphingobacteriia bacterium]|nr:hypothetical protein [Sphingobacteriia bacterium]
MGDTVVHRYGDRVLKQSELAMWLEEEQKNAAGADPAIHLRNVTKRARIKLSSPTKTAVWKANTLPLRP